MFRVSVEDKSHEKVENAIKTYRDTGVYGVPLYSSLSRVSIDGFPLHYEAFYQRDVRKLPTSWNPGTSLSQERCTARTSVLPVGAGRVPSPKYYQIY